MAEKLFVNDVAEIDGVVPVEALVLVDAGVLVALVVLLELDDELPHAATPMLAATASMATRALLFSKCICVSPPTSGLAATRRAAAKTVETDCDTRGVCVNEPLISAAARKHAVNTVTTLTRVRLLRYEAVAGSRRGDDQRLLLVDLELRA
jgi:hypothetical protein